MEDILKDLWNTIKVTKSTILEIPDVKDKKGEKDYLKI